MNLVTTVTICGAQIGVGLGLIWGTKKIFKEIESVASKHTQTAVGVWLLDLHSPRLLEPWPETFLRIFEIVFGSKQLSLECLFKSLLGTISAFIFSILVLHDWYRANLEDLQRLGSEGSTIELNEIIIVAILNIVLDYISLAKTRYLLKLARKQEKIIIQFIALIADLLLSFLLVAAAGIGALVIAVSIGQLIDPELGGIKGPEEIVGISMIVTFFVGFVGACLGSRLVFTVDHFGIPSKSPPWPRDPNDLVQTCCRRRRGAAGSYWASRGSVGRNWLLDLCFLGPVAFEITKDSILVHSVSARL